MNRFSQLDEWLFDGLTDPAGLRFDPMEFLLWLVVLVVVVGGGLWVWRNRTRLLARALGQPESRVQRHLDRRRD